MKTLIKSSLLIIIMLLACPAWGEDRLAMNWGLWAGQTQPGCNTSTDFIGLKSTGSTTNATQSGVILLSPMTASCTGDLNTGYIYHANTTQSEAVICIYEKTAAGPASANVLIGQSTEINLTTSTGWFNAPVSGSVVSGVEYWIGIFVSGSAWATIGKNQVQNSYYKSVAGYPTCPATAGLSWSFYAGNGPFSVWTSIGD